MMPVGTASPKAWVAWSTSPQVAPPSARTVRASGSTRTPPHPRKVYYQPVVGYAQATSVVPPAADRQEHVVLLSEVHRGDHVGYVSAISYQAWAFGDHGVVDLAGFIVVRV